MNTPVIFKNIRAIYRLGITHPKRSKNKSSLVFRANTKASNHDKKKNVKLFFRTLACLPTVLFNFQLRFFSFQLFIWFDQLVSNYNSYRLKMDYKSNIFKNNLA